MENNEIDKEKLKEEKEQKEVQMIEDEEKRRLKEDFRSTRFHQYIDDEFSAEIDDTNRLDTIPHTGDRDKMIIAMLAQKEVTRRLNNFKKRIL